jgi:hypothetical protein
MTDVAQLAARVAELEATIARLRGQAGATDRAHAAKLMSARTWHAIYGQPVPGSSRPLAEVATGHQLAARGRVWGEAAGGAEVHYGQEEQPWR